MYGLAVHEYFAGSLKQSSHVSKVSILFYEVTKLSLLLIRCLYYLVTYLFLPQLNNAPERDKAKL